MVKYVFWDNKIPDNFPQMGVRKIFGKLFVTTTVSSPTEYIFAVETAQSLNILFKIKGKVEIGKNCVSCISTRKNIHNNTVIYYLTEGAELSIESYNIWKWKTSVKSREIFILSNRSKLTINSKTVVGKDSRISYTQYIVVLGNNCKVDVRSLLLNHSSSIYKEIFYILGNKCSAEYTIAAAGMDRSRTSMYTFVFDKGKENISRIVCDEKIIGNCEMLSIPAIKVLDRSSKVYHEASIGRIEEEKITYLRARGFSEEEAIRKIIGII